MEIWGQIRKRSRQSDTIPSFSTSPGRHRVPAVAPLPPPDCLTHSEELRLEGALGRGAAGQSASAGRTKERKYRGLSAQRAQAAQSGYLA